MTHTHHLNFHSHQKTFISSAKTSVSRLKMPATTRGGAFNNPFGPRWHLERKEKRIQRVRVSNVRRLRRARARSCFFFTHKIRRRGHVFARRCLLWRCMGMNYVSLGPSLQGCKESPPPYPLPPRRYTISSPIHFLLLLHRLGERGTLSFYQLLGRETLLAWG